MTTKEKVLKTMEDELDDMFEMYRITSDRGFIPEIKELEREIKSLKKEIEKESL